MNLPIRTLGLMAAALLIGGSLAPASAQQQQSGLDGQVAVRSDGALYLISNGQRRWISTVVATDEQINAIPEGQPILTGLALAGSAGAAQTTPASKTPAASSKTPTAKPATKTSFTPPSKTSSPNDNEDERSGSIDDGTELSRDIPIEVDVEGELSLERDESREVVIKTNPDVTCELVIRFADGDEMAEDSQNADNEGRCRYTIEIPDDAEEGEATVIGTVRVGGKANRQEITIEIDE